MVVASFSKFENHTETLADHDNDSELCLESTDLGGFLTRTVDNISLCIMDVVAGFQEDKPVKAVATIVDAVKRWNGMTQS